MAAVNMSDKKAGVVFALSISLFAATMVQAKDSSGGHTCYSPKTVGALPAGAPLPDVDVPQNDNITPDDAYERAKECLSKNHGADATEYFERAIRALRRTKGHCDKKLVKNIVTDYGQLLRAHLGTRKADALEIEFLSRQN